MNQGKSFEEQFKASIPDDIYWLRLRDPAQSFGTNSALRFSLPNPYDFMLFKDGNLYVIELKSTKEKSVSFKGSSPMIKQHQIDELTRASQYDRITAGFIFNFRSLPATYFMNIIDFNKYVESTTKSSININDVIQFNGLEIPATLKRVKYNYNLSVLLP